MDLALIEKAFSAYRTNATESDRARYDFFEGLYRLIDARAKEVGAPFAEELPGAEELRRWYWNFSLCSKTTRSPSAPTRSRQRARRWQPIW